MTQLHLGCGNFKFPGFVNVDARKTEATDIVAPAWDIPGIAKNSVTLIYTRHMLEHLDPNEARLALKHWFDLLTEDGYAIIIVPDIEFHAKQLLGLANSNQVKFPDQQQHAFNSLWGWRDENRGGNREDAHKWGYTEATLFAALKEAGFGYGQRQTSGKDSEPWHLNVVASKSSAPIKQPT